MRDKIGTLKRTKLFENLSDNALMALATRAIERGLVANEVLFSAGDQADGLYVVASGAVRAVRESSDGREQVIHVERAGATIAEVPVFDDGNYPSTVIAEEPTLLLFIDKNDIKRLIIEHPQIALSALAVMAGRLRKCAQLVESLSLRPVSQRLAAWLISEAKAKGLKNAEGVRINITLTNQQIAARIGSVREVVSRAFNQLQQESLIVLTGRVVLIPDLTKLSEFAE